MFRELTPQANTCLATHSLPGASRSSNRYKGECSYSFHLIVATVSSLQVHFSEASLFTNVGSLDSEYSVSSLGCMLLLCWTYAILCLIKQSRKVFIYTACGLYDMILEYYVVDVSEPKDFLSLVFNEKLDYQWAFQFPKH